MNDEVDVVEPITALALLQAIYRNPNLPLPVRHRAARDAVGYESPKLGVVMNVNGEGLALALEERIARREALKLIEAPAPTSQPSASAGSPVEARPFVHFKRRI
jgi:hypothetical protein